MSRSRSAVDKGAGHDELGADGYPSGYPKVFWVGLVVGGVVMAIGVRGLLINSGAVMDTNPSRSAPLALIVNVVHDVVLVPVVFLVGFLISRLVPQRLRAAVQGGVIAASIVALYAFPLVGRFGVDPANPTILPRDYGRGLFIVLAVIGVVTAASALAAHRRGPTER